MRSLGVGIVGAGFIGRVHARAARLAGARLIGVVASTPDRSSQAAQELGAEEQFADERTLIAHPSVDVVHVCTPNHLHRPIVERVLAEGKHVVCEKPLATSANDAAALATQSKEAGLIAAVPFAYRYHAMVHEARARLLAGHIGAVHLIHGSYLQDWLLTPDDGNWRVSANLGGPSRAFADIGAHWCDLVEWLTNQRILEVCATVETVVPKRLEADGHTFEDDRSSPHDQLQRVDTEDVACLIFRASGDILGTLTVSQVSAGRKNRIWIEIDGREASLVFDEDRPDRLWIGRRRANEELLRDPVALSPAARRVSVLPPGHHEGFLDNFVAFSRDVYGAVAGNDSLDYPSFDDGVRSARITEAVLRSSTERAWVKVEP